MWNHLLTLPVSRAKVFGAKILAVAGLVLLMTVVLYVALYAVVAACIAIIPGAEATGAPQFADTFASLLLMDGAAFTMVIVQLWIALRVRSFALPLVVGIVGTFFALCIQSARTPIFLPWVAPAYAFTIVRPESFAVVAFGYLGGLALTPVMLWRLSRLQRTS
jgi:ABC-2 type transport system permease protein